MFDAFYFHAAQKLGQKLGAAWNVSQSPGMPAGLPTGLPTAEGERAYHQFRLVVERAALVHERKTCLADLKTMLGSMGHSYYFDANEREKLERSRRLTARVAEIDSLLEVANG